jgi:hypothetical protein
MDDWLKRKDRENEENEERKIEWLKKQVLITKLEKMRMTEINKDDQRNDWNVLLIERGIL